MSENLPFPRPGDRVLTYGPRGGPGTILTRGLSGQYTIRLDSGRLAYLYADAVAGFTRIRRRNNETYTKTFTSGAPRRGQ